MDNDLGGRLIDAQHVSFKAQAVYKNLVELIDQLPEGDENIAHCRAILPMAELIRSNLMKRVETLIQETRNGDQS